MSASVAKPTAPVGNPPVLMEEGETWSDLLNALEIQLPQRKPLEEGQSIGLPFLLFKTKRIRAKFETQLVKLLQQLPATKGYSPVLFKSNYNTSRMPPELKNYKMAVKVIIFRSAHEATVGATLIHRELGK